MPFLTECAGVPITQGLPPMIDGIRQGAMFGLWEGRESGITAGPMTFAEALEQCQPERGIVAYDAGPFQPGSLTPDEQTLADAAADRNHRAWEERARKRLDIKPR